MKMDSEQVLDSIFLSYNKILKRFQLLGVTTKYGKEITHEDLRKAIEVMLKKHPTCRWRSEKVKSRKYFILAEGYAWLNQVYFQKEKSLADADVDFFEDSFVTIGADPEAKILEKVASRSQYCGVQRISKSETRDLSYIINEKNQRTFSGRVESFAEKLKNIPWS